MVQVTALRFSLELTFKSASLEQSIAELNAAVEGSTWPPVIGILSPVRAKPTKGKAPKNPDLHATLANAQSWISGDTFTLQFGDLSSLGLGHNGSTGNVGISLSVGDGLFTDSASYLAAIIHVVRRLLARELLIGAELVRFNEPRGGCVPSVPLAGRREPMVITTDAEIAENYDRPEDFLAAGWKIERFGARILLTRLLSSLDRKQILAESQSDQWKMARAAKPGKTFYDDPIVLPDEKAMFEEGEPRLRFVGVTTTGLAEFSCALVKGDHLLGFDIYYMREVIERKQLRSGTPVTDLRIVFMDKWAAEAEKRPLLDVGARVFYMDEGTGNDIEIKV